MGARAAVVLVASSARRRRRIAGETRNDVLVCVGQPLGDERTQREDEGDGGWRERAGLEIHDGAELDEGKDDCEGDGVSFG